MWRLAFSVAGTARVAGATVRRRGGGELDVSRSASPLSLSNCLDVFGRQRYVTQELVCSNSQRSYHCCTGEEDSHRQQRDLG